MAHLGTTLLPDILRQRHNEILNEWLQLQIESVTARRDLISEAELRQQSRDLLSALTIAVAAGERFESGSSWAPVRELLSRVSESRARQGFSTSETATFILSLKQPLFTQLQASVPDAAALAREIWSTTILLDKMGLYTTESYQKNRDGIIMRQQQEMLELSTPVVTMWQGVLALPLIGTLDSA